MVHGAIPHPTSGLPGPQIRAYPIKKPHPTTGDTHTLSPQHSTRFKQTHITHYNIIRTKHQYSPNLITFSIFAAPCTTSSNCLYNSWAPDDGHNDAWNMLSMFCNKNQSVASSWPFIFHVLTMMQGQTHIKTCSVSGGFATLTPNIQCTAKFPACLESGVHVNCILSS